MTPPPPFMDVIVDGDVIDLPRLKLRELLFVGSLRADADGVLARDVTRPMPPFRVPDLFPPGARWAREDRGDRVRLRRLPGPTPAPPACS